MGEERVVDKQRLWQNVLGEAEVSLSKANFNTWLKNTEMVEITDTEVLLRVPNVFTLEWLQKKYEKELLRCLVKSLPRLVSIKYVVGNSPRQEQTNLFSAPSAVAAPSASTGRTGSTTNRATANGEAVERLNSRYTFESFVVGESNKLANAAATAVAKAPGITYNPLFVYGGVGLGKTHLLQAVGNEILTLYPKKRVVYVTSERFTNELVDAIHKKTTKEFREKYRKVDCLIIDDVQFLAGREATQEEFFNTFNALYESNKQIVLASDRPPKAIPTLEARLRSRFEWGMIADISAPNYEMRLAVLRSKADNLDFQLPDYILEAIAGKIQNNIRELEGALTRVVAYGQLNDTTPTADEVENLLGGILFSPGKRVVKISDVIKTICKHYDMKKDELLGKRRNKEIVFPRQVLIYLLREELDLPYKSIGRELGGRDHTTIIHDYNKIKNALMENNDLEGEIKAIKDKLYTVD